MTRIEATDIKFGIEVETNMPERFAPYVGPYHRGKRQSWLPSYDGKMWKAENDCSIHAPPGRTDSEFVSPVLCGRVGMENAMQAIRKIKSRDAMVNDSCGIHVSVNFTGDDKALARLINLVARFEPALRAITGSKYRENGTYAASVRRHENSCHHADSTTKANRMRRRLAYDKFHMLNLSCYRPHVGERRIEWRAFPSTLCPTTFAGYVWVALGMTQLAINSKRMLSWRSKAKWADGFGEGYQNLEVLLEKLGWSYTYNGESGIVRSESTPHSKAVVKSLRKLAKEYGQA